MLEKNNGWINIKWGWMMEEQFHLTGTVEDVENASCFEMLPHTIYFKRYCKLCKNEADKCECLNYETYSANKIFMCATDGKGIWKVNIKQGKHIRCSTLNIKPNMFVALQKSTHKFIYRDDDKHVDSFSYLLYVKYLLIRKIIMMQYDNTDIAMYCGVSFLRLFVF